MPLTGRRFAGPAALAAALLCTGGPGAASGVEPANLPAPPANAPIHDLPNPPVIRSDKGVLRTTFTAAPAEVTVAGQTFTSNVFNGLYTPPTLRVRRGDRMRLTVVNNIGAADVEVDGPELTNLHYHGMDVSPIPPGDNVFIHIQPQDSFENRFLIPKDHPEGLHWYHTHLHGFVEPQILSGLSGMIIVDGMFEDHYPELVGVRKRVMLLKANLLPGQDPDSALTKTINGYSNPPIRIRPGAYQVWMIGNLGADAFFNLALDGHQFWVLERDGNMLLKPVKQQTLFLPAGARTTVVVRAGAKGTYALRSLATDTGPQGDPNPEVVVGTVIVDGPPVDNAQIAHRLGKPAASPGTITPKARQIAKLQITNRRTFVFSETPDGNTFFINGKEYKENRIDTTVRLGAVEEWTILNTSGELHVFHIHQLSFLVTEVNGEQPDYLGLRDVIDLPYKTGGKPGVVKMIVPFTNPIMVGKFVYHCHIVGHEDAGMMANIRVLPPSRSAAGQTLDWVRTLATRGPSVAWASLTGGPAEAVQLADAGVPDDADICRAEVPIRPSDLR